MLKYGRVIEVHGRMFGGASVFDKFKDGAGELVTDAYECANEEELISVLEALDVVDCGNHACQR